ncbi:MAG: di-trans,poly-cis-decaprenylcistransferase [Deltaproteobacteria bacterium]|nr:di-trans,poly-cis-decaprenylcistransferase [Deltaproteobacteria bacterium]
MIAPPTNEAGVRPAPQPTSWVRALWGAIKYLIKWPFYFVYKRYLQAKVGTWRLPRHIGIIMDGNRRFARRSGLGSASRGHALGAEKLMDVLSWCYEMGISVVTVWSFSLDNFNRDTSEVAALLQLFEDKTRQMVNDSEVHDNEVRVRYIGELEMLPEGLRKEIQAVEEATADYQRFQLNIAMAYGGREEITEAFRAFLKDEASQGRDLEAVISGFKGSAIEPYLYTSGQPEPDLILRTSGEVRLSGFLLWQSAYSEYYFCDATWPAIRKIDFLRALRTYHDRQRRFGR